MMRDALCLVYKQVLDASPSVFLATHNNIEVFISPRDVVVGGMVTWLLSQWWPVGFLTPSLPPGAVDDSRQKCAQMVPFLERDPEGILDA